MLCTTLMLGLCVMQAQSGPAVDDSNGLGPVCVRTYGAKGDGATDDTAAIDRAAGVAKDRPLYFPKGTYVYNGLGRTGTQMKFIGDGKDASIIKLGQGKFFIDDSQHWSSLQVRGLRFEGGAGAIRNRFTGVNVANLFEVDDCYFYNYTGAAISVNASDDPYWKITRSTFRAANSDTTIGVALSGLTDSTTLADDAFINNRVHIKLGKGGNNAHIVNSEFIQFSPGRGRVSVWIVPSTGPGYRNAGQGLTITASKFGNENLDASDKRILYADEAPGELFGDRMYSALPSAGYIAGHSVSNIYVAGSGGTNQPLVYSYTPNVSGCVYSFITSAGTPPSYILEFARPLEPDLYNSTNLFGPIQFDSVPGSGTTTATKATNGIGAGAIADPTGALIGNDPSQVGPYVAGSSQAGFRNLQTGGISAYRTYRGAAKSPATDAAGGNDAAELRLPLHSLVKGGLAQAAFVGVPLWIEFDLKGTSNSPLDAVLVKAEAEDGSMVHFQRLIKVPPGWRRYRLMFAPRSVPKTGLSVGFENSLTAFGAVLVGRVNVYQAYEPINGNQFLGPVTLDGSLNVSGRGTFNGVGVNPAGTISIVSGSGSPTGNCTTGALYLRSDGGQATTLYVCQAGAWAPK